MDPEDNRSVTSGSELVIPQIQTLIQRAVPESGSITEEAEILIELCAVEFVQFFTLDVCEKMRIESRKTLHGNDILQSFAKFGLMEYVTVLDHWLKVFKHGEPPNAGEDGEEAEEQRRGSASSAAAVAVGAEGRRKSSKRSTKDTGDESAVQKRGRSSSASSARGRRK